MAVVAVTGATGFIGSHLVRKNLEKGHHVRALARPIHARTGTGLPDHTRLHVVYADIRDAEAVEKMIMGAQRVFHCAALVTDWAPRKLFREIDVTGTENVCRAALKTGVERLIHISTNDVFGQTEDHVIDESMPMQDWKEPYPDYKIKMDEVIWRSWHEQRLPVTMVYPCWVYGEGDKTFLPELIPAIMDRSFAFMRRDALFWPTYIDNLVDLMMLAAEDPQAVGQGYLVHDGEALTFEKLCTDIAVSLGVRPVQAHIPYPLALTGAFLLECVWRLLRRTRRPLLTTYMVKNFGSRKRYSITKARDQLGWAPGITFKRGFNRTMTWWKQAGNERPAPE
jgi:nucleoside-diphosphate-sugar epimerase